MRELLSTRRAGRGQWDRRRRVSQGQAEHHLPQGELEEEHGEELGLGIFQVRRSSLVMFYGLKVNM